MPATTGAYFRAELAKARRRPHAMSATCAATACWRRSSSSRTGTTASSSIRREKIGPQVAAALLERGVIGRAMPQGDILGFAPPLCLTRDEADIVVAATADAIKAVLG